MNKCSILKRSERVILRTISEPHMQLLFYWRTLRNNRKWFFSKNISYTSHREWFFNNIVDDNDYTFIATDYNEIPIGTVAIYNINWDTKSAQFGRLLVANPDYIGLGYGFEIARSAVEVAFEQLGLEELTLEVMRDNYVAYSLYSKLGWRKILFDEDSTIMRLTK